MIYLVSGSRSLLKLVGGREWVLSILTEKFSQPDTTLVTGFADGPDKWSLALAHELGVAAYSYQPSGLIVCGDRTWRWDKDHGPPPAHSAPKGAWKAWFLLRDRVMVDHLALRVDKGASVTVLGFVDPSSTTKGTDYTLKYAQEKGLPVDRGVYASF